ncbi:acyltransferase [Xanthobacter sp. ZOL 2024]
MEVHGVGNAVSIGGNAKIAGRVIGDHNHIFIQDSSALSMTLHVRGSHNRVVIGRGFRTRDLNVSIGNAVPAHRVTLEIGDHCSTEPNCSFYLYNSGNSLGIGNACMFSNSIIIRTGESPHLIFDDESGDYLDTVGNVTIGDHSWIGERAYITKNASIAPETIVAACSVVTRRFDEQMTVLAGNPASVKKRGIRWIRNQTLLPKDSKFRNGFDAFHAQFSPAASSES